MQNNSGQKKFIMFLPWTCLDPNIDNTYPDQHKIGMDSEHQLKTLTLEENHISLFFSYSYDF